MIDAVNNGALCLEKLEAMTAVCSVGLDMIVVPGDITAETISAIIADEAAIGMVNNKTTAVRLIPAIGKNVGDHSGIRRSFRQRTGNEYKQKISCQIYFKRRKNTCAYAQY